MKPLSFPSLLAILVGLSALELARRTVFADVGRPDWMGGARGKTIEEDRGDDECLRHLPSCDLRCLDWTIVLALGRSGSTTVQSMISKLPGMNFYGEEGGLLEQLQQFQKAIYKSRTHPDLGWRGAKDANVTTVACMTQKFYAERHGVNCLTRGCRHGWKEIRYGSPENVTWIRTLFPSSKIVLNYRSACPGGKYKDIFGRNCTELDEEKATLLKAAGHLRDVFHMETEQLNNLTRWQGLANFLGYDNCTARNVTVANGKRGYTDPDAFESIDPWRCL